MTPDVTDHTLSTTMDLEREIQSFGEDLSRLRSEIKKSIVGQEEVIDQILVCLLADGHALLEGAPGLGKTLMVKTLANCLALDFRRIQFTPDLMPADILGTNLVVERDGRKEFEFQPGPIFGNVVLADEINRATPKTQSALLEVMEEHAVTIAGKRRPVDEPFLVLATQNPIEMEGTYPLPEAQLDRFLFKIHIEAPDEETLVQILDATTGSKRGTPEAVLDADRVHALRAIARQVPIAPPLVRYVARLIQATQPQNEDASDVARKYLRYGASVRGAQSIVLASKVQALMAGRPNVAFEDLRAAALPALRHRLILNFEGEAEGVHRDDILKRILEGLPELPADLANA